MKNIVKVTTVIAFMFATVAGSANERNLVVPSQKANATINLVDPVDEVKPFFKKAKKMVYMNYLNLSKSELLIKVYDQDNKLVFSQKVKDKVIVEKAFNFNEANDGMYTVVVSSPDSSFTEEFIVK